MAVRKVYYGDEDAPLWDAAQRVADHRRISVSRLVREALEAHLPHAMTPPAADRWAAIAPDAA